MKNVLKALGGFGIKIFEMLRHNWGYKLLAFIFAFVLWASVMSGSNPERVVTLSDIPVRIDNLDALREKGMTLQHAVEAYARTAQVRLEVRRNDLDRVTDSTVVLWVDLGTINATGGHQLEIRSMTTLGSVVSITPSSLTVEADQYTEDVIPVQVATENALGEGYWRDTLSLTPSVIEVRGPRKLIDRIARAQVTLDLAPITSDYNASHPFALLDEDGNEIEETAISLSSESVILSMQVRPTREVPLLAEQAVVGDDRLPRGYEIAGIEVYPATVTVAAPAEILDTIEGIALSPIDVANAVSDVYGTVSMSVPEGVVVLGEKTAELMVRVRETETTKTFDEVPIQIRGLGDGISAEPVTQTATVTVTGPVNAMGDLIKSGVKLYVDASGLAPGTHTLRVLSDIDERYRVRDVDISIETLVVQLTAGKK